MTASIVQLDNCEAVVTTGAYALGPEQQRKALAPTNSEQVEHHEAAGRSSGVLGVLVHFQSFARNATLVILDTRSRSRTGSHVSFHGADVI